MAVLPSHGDDIVYEGKLPPYPAPIFVSVALGEKRLDYMGLHLATNTMTLDSRHRSLLGEPLKDERRISPTGEIETVKRYRVSDMSLGVLPIAEEGLCVSDFSRLNAFTGFPGDGQFGVESLMNCRIELFYSEEKLRIRKGGSQEMPGFQRVPVSILGGLPAIRLKVWGEMEYFFLSTTGNTAVTLGEKTFERLSKAGALQKREEPNIMISEKAPSYVSSGRILKLELFGRKLDGMVVASEKGDYNILGTSFLMGYDSVLDLPGLQFWYRPAEIKHTPLELDLMVGMRMQYSNGGVVALAIQKGGAADTAGMHTNDRLSRFGEITEGSFNLISMQQACQTYQGKEVEIEFYQHSTEKVIKTKVKLPPAIPSTKFFQK